MKKYLAIFITAIISVTSFCSPELCYASNKKPRLSARSAIIYDSKSGRVIYSKNALDKRAPASLTKIMTAIVVLDRLKLNKVVCISPKASKAQPSKVYIRSGECYTVRDLLYAMLLNSGNDAAVAVSEAVAGSEWKFVQLMNKRALSLGCKRTRFINASGLPGKGQYSTAFDLALIMREAMRYPFIRKALNRRSYTIARPNGKKIRLRSHNKLLWKYSKKVVGKTGYTRAAGRCFLGHSNYGGRKVIVCVLKSGTMWQDVRHLVDYVFGQDNHQIIRLNRKLYGKTKVKQIQRALKRAGFNPGKVDGIFGRQTLNAVLSFQKHYQLKIDGVIGPQTLGHLQRFF